MPEKMKPILNRNPMSIVEEKAYLCEKIINIQHPEFMNKEVVEKSKVYMKKSLMDLQLIYSRIKK